MLTTFGVNPSILPVPSPLPSVFSPPSAIVVTSMMQKRASTTSEAGITTLTYLWNDEQKNNPYWYLPDKSIDVSSTTLFL